MSEPTRQQIDQMPGLVVLEFGTTWCPHCQAAQPFLKSLLGQHPEVQHLFVEDGRGRPLGRSFKVTLWPTMVFLRDGEVLDQMARPSRQEMANGFADLLGHAKYK